MEMSFLLVNGVPTKLLTLGKNVEEKPEKIVLIIPGNPGIAAYYEDFMTTLKGNISSDYSIWTIAHAGQEIPPPDLNLPPISGNESLYNLTGQIQHKIDFVRNYVPENAQVILIGHSIGCKMILEVMKSTEVNKTSIHNAQGLLLFPTIEWMKASPAGQRGWISVNYIPKLLVGIAWILSILVPRSISSKLVTWWTSTKSNGCIEATLDLINPRVIENMLFLAKTELETVNEPDYEIISKLNKQLKFYYGTIDAWVPIDYYDRLIKAVPDVDVKLCQNKVPHAFVLHKSEFMAEIVAVWINEKNNE